MTYAKKTKVPVDRTRMEIEKLLEKHGADQFLSGWEEGRATIGFRMRERYIRLELPLKGKSGIKLSDQQTRARWRALVLVLKAKLEAVEAGIVSFDTEFMAHVVMPDGKTIGMHVAPRITEAYKTGKLPALLPAAGAS